MELAAVKISGPRMAWNTSDSISRTKIEVAYENWGIAVTDLEGEWAPNPTPPLFFAGYLPSTVNKTQDLRPQTLFFSLFRGVPPPPLLERALPFRNFWIHHCIIYKPPYCYNDSGIENKTVETTVIILLSVAYLNLTRCPRVLTVT
jgi:hypothetical protein